MENLKLIKLSIIVTNIFLTLLAIFTVALPWAVTWYVETMGRSASLPTTIMVTCYPCVPFAAAILINLRRLLKNILKDSLFSDDTVYFLYNISVCCIVIAVITLVAGGFYLPFYIVATTFAFLSLLIFALRGIFLIEIKNHQ